jgi:hypothetical protein
MEVGTDNTAHERRGGGDADQPPLESDHEHWSGTGHPATSSPHAWREVHEAAGAVLLAEFMQFFMNSLCASPGAIF